MNGIGCGRQLENAALKFVLDIPRLAWHHTDLSVKIFEDKTLPHLDLREGMQREHIQKGTVDFKSKVEKRSLAGR